MTKLMKLFALVPLLACLWAAPAVAACGGGASNCFVTPTGGNSATNTTWSQTSGGSSCACLPAATDHVILDSLAGQLTINGALSVGTFDASGTGGSGSPYTNTLSHSGGIVLTINTAATNSLVFSTQMTYSPATSTTTGVTFANTSGTAQVTSAGKVFTLITMNGVGGTAQQLDDINITHGVAMTAGALIVTNGTWDANGHAITAAGIVITGSSARGLLLGSSVTISGNFGAAANLWNSATTTLLTFTKNSANIELTGSTAAVQGGTFSGGGLTFNGLTLDNLTTPYGLNFLGNNGFSTITIGAGWVVTLPSAGTQTLSGALTLSGNSTHPATLESLSASAVATVSAAGACSATWAVIWGVTLSGTCTGFTATNSINLGTTSGWTITPPVSGTTRGVFGG